MRMVRRLVVVVAVLAITFVPMLADAQRIMGYRPVTTSGSPSRKRPTG